ncbi:hypothetical protein ACHAWF_009846 [Thalassiosira exigua]
MSIVHELVDASEWNVIPVRFRGFEALGSARNSVVYSPEFECLGHRWRVEIYPGGYGGGYLHSEEGMVSVYLRNCSEASIEVKYSFAIKNSLGYEVALKKHEKRQKFGSLDRGWRNFAERSKVIDALVEGALVIEVRLKAKAKGPSSHFFGENPFCKAMLSYFLDKETGESCFGWKMGANQLEKLASVLGQEGLVHIPITGVEPESFRLMLYYIYGGKLTKKDFEERSKDILEAANKFGVTNLKLEAESWFVRSTQISTKHVLDLMLYADSMSCALLKEVVMDFIVANRAEVIEKISFGDAPGSIASDILAATMRKDSDGNGDEMMCTMRVSQLRKVLHQKGLDIDGSRETLIALIKENA